MMLVQVHGSAHPMSCHLSKHQRFSGVQNNLRFNSANIPSPSILIRVMHLSGAGVITHSSTANGQFHFNIAIFFLLFFIYHVIFTFTFDRPMLFKTIMITESRNSLLMIIEGLSITENVCVGFWFCVLRCFHSNKE